MDPNGYTRPFQFTKTMRREIYPAIDPKNPELSAAGKVILITGATGGIGGEVARAWATAGAKGVVLLGGRNKHLLQEPEEAVKAISPTTQVLALTADLSSEAEAGAVFKKSIETFGTIDVVVHTASVMATGPIANLSPDEWFRAYEVNVKGSYILAQQYLKSVSGGTIVFLNSLAAANTAPGISAYSGSKMALVKLAESLNAEQPNLRVFSVHPGIVAQTETGRGGFVEAFAPFAHDKGIQTGGLSLYLAKPKADFLRGSFITANWDVEEMEAHKDEIVENKLLKLAFLKGKLGPEGHPWST